MVKMYYPEKILERNLGPECCFFSSRSSGPGGQNVNKVNTRIELRFDLLNSKILTESEKAVIAVKLKKRITSEGFIIVTSQSERSQLGNKKKAIEKLYALLSKALEVKTPRKSTSPTRASIKRRIESKKKKSVIKKLRWKSDGFYDE